jgi:hypothetical protein
MKFEALMSPSRLYSRSEILSVNSPVPSTRGLYAWFFRQPPDNIPLNDCVKIQGKVLLYAGISPKNETSKQNLRLRIRTHFSGNSEGSTLRLTLGVLLATQSGFPLRRVGSGKRMTLTHIGEQWLDDWMETNAFVCWVEHQSPWSVERELITSVSLPLNIMDNDRHPFSTELSRLRSLAKKSAREMPIANEDNQTRKYN